VKADLSKTEDSSGDAIEELIEILKSGDREKFDTKYRTFRTNETISARANLIPDVRQSQESSYIENLPSLQSSQVLHSDSRLQHIVSQPRPTSDSAPPFDVEFEPTLKYVDLPAFDGIEANKREEAKIILEWLRKSRIVKRIFHLSVADSLHEPHSEETIEDAIKPFDIKILDWRRIDLSIRTIRDAAPNIRRLRLYSSGNWAPLDHWIGADGVCTLQKVCLAATSADLVLMDLLVAGVCSYYYF
jgi:hypothetical protein